ncbi:MAG: molybdopterin-dependent oxidoreductase [Candidatus Hodarchaeota archaeon]
MKKRFLCSICDASCGLIALVKDNEVVRILPDKKHPVSKGYCCPKGLALADITNDPDRIRVPMKYNDGKWISISWRQAITEISEKLTSLMDRYGPNSIASHMGTNGGHR